MPVERMFKKSAEKLLGNTSGGLLLAVSGGADSMVMLHLFAQWIQSYGGRKACTSLLVAHMNFSLRGAESDEDQRFVELRAQEYGIPVVVKKVDAAAVARERGVSVEVAARDLRYGWFESLATSRGLSHVAIAHNANDRAETMLLNLIRGTGLRGLCGIREQRGNIVRPLLEIPSEAILEYARRHDIPFRIDSTNLSTDFSRNKIRHRVMPVLEDMVPGVVSRMGKNADNLLQAMLLLDDLTEKKRTECASARGFSIPCLLGGGHVPFWMHALLSEYGFHPGQTAAVARSLEGQSGKQFLSPTHVLWIDRDELVIRELVQQEEVQQITFERLERKPGFVIPQERNVAALDADILEYPLTVRKPKPGDKFMPLGMKGFKKISDFLTDEKVPLYEKENIRLLCSGQDIVWVAGRRIDERFKVTDATTSIMLFRQKEGGPGFPVLSEG